MKRFIPLVVCLLVAAGCLAGPVPSEREGAGATEPGAPTILRLRGALSDGIEPWALTWVGARGEGCPLQPGAARVYAGPATLAADDTSDLVSRATRDGAGGYTLELPWRWSTGRCAYEATGVSVHASAAGRPLDDLGAAVFRLGTYRMEQSTDIAGIGTLSCRNDPFSREGLTCRRASGPVETGADPATGLTFFSHLDVPPATGAGPTTVDVPLDILERRASCQRAACEPGCAPGEAGCLPSDCDPARDCAAALTSVRQDVPVAIAARGALVSRSELFVDGDAAAPARLADLVVDLDFFAPNDLAIRVLHAGTVTTVLDRGLQPPPRFGSPGQGRYVIPLDAAAAASPGGAWTLEVEQRRPFFTGAVLSWGLDLYR